MSLDNRNTQARIAPEVFTIDDSESCASTVVDGDLIHKTLHSDRQGALCDLTGRYVKLNGWSAWL
jgi:hypothetical protein